MDRPAVRLLGRRAECDFLAATPSGAGSSPDATEWLAGTLPEAIERVEIAMIRRAMAETGNRTQAAERLGIRRQLLYQKLARYALDVSPNGTADVPEGDNDA